MNIEKPIFIIGVPRSGTTIFYELFSKHPNIAWLSGLCNKFPNHPEISRFFLKAIDIPVAGKILLQLIKPGEIYDFWENYNKGFRRPIRDLGASDVTNKTREKLRLAFSKVLTEKRNRLMVKVTGWPRLGFIKEIFPGAKFIHFLRDGRAVANSLINEPWWWGWRGPQNWRWGDLPSPYQREWDSHQRSFIVLAGIQWKMLLDALEETKQDVAQDSFLQVKYEELCRQPVSAFEKIANFSELPWNESFASTIEKSNLRSTNERWQQELTEAQISSLNKVLQTHLIRYGYAKAVSLVQKALNGVNS